MLLGILIALLVTGTSPAIASPDELNIFDDEESYVVGDQTIVVQRVADEMVVRFHSTNAPLDAVTEWSATTGHALEGVKEVFGGAALCRVPLTNDPGSVTATFNALRNDPAVRYAFPIYRSVPYGTRLFLNDEVVVSGNFSDPWYREFGLTYVQTVLSFRVLRLTAPNSVNPFKLCALLRSQPGVAWAEPNKSQEWRFPPVGDTTPVVISTNFVPVYPPLTNVLNLPPAFTRISPQDGNIVVEWIGAGTLQSSENPTGPWSDVDGATNIHVAPLSGAGRFFRLRSN